VIEHWGGKTHPKGGGGKREDRARKKKCMLTETMKQILRLRNGLKKGGGIVGKKEKRGDEEKERGKLGGARPLIFLEREKGVKKNGSSSLRGLFL